MQQCIQLTDTNRPRGLAIFFKITKYPFHLLEEQKNILLRRLPRNDLKASVIPVNVQTILVSGGYSEGVTPVPISNTEVKPLSADGTAWATAWESKSPPDLI